MDRLLARYGLAVIAVGAAFALRQGLSILFGPSTPYITFYPAIMLTALLAGAGPGILGTLLSAMLVAHQIHLPVGQFLPLATPDLIGLLLFSAGGVFISVVAGLYRRNKTRIVESEERFRTLADNIPQLAWMADEKGNVFWFNQRWFEFTGSTQQEMEGMGWKKVLHPDHLERVVEGFSTSLATGEVWEEIFPMRAADGSYRWFLSRAIPLRDSRGQICRWFGTNTDVTEQREIEQALRESESLYRAIARNIPEGGVWVVDRDLRYLVVEGSLVARLGVDPEEVEGRTIHDVGGEQSLFEELRWRRALAGEVTSYETVYRDRYLWSQYAPLREESGSIVGAMALALDMTERKRMEQELRAAKNEAEEATRAKSEFLANMSHEIRTPMTVFMAALEYLLQIDTDPERRQLLGMAENSAERLRSLIDDILDFSRIEARRLEVEEEAFELRACVKNAVDLFAIPAAEKNLRLDLDIAPEVPDLVRGDSGRLGQVLTNLLGNAVKFTEKGEVKVRVEAKGGELLFSVADTGIGIPEEKGNLLFQSFSQVDASRTRKYGGTGLGLAISKGLVELMGGEIGVRSRVGEGSVFFFTLPLKIAQSSDRVVLPDE